MTRKLALIIGNSEYEDSSLARLATPDADVRTLAEVLRTPEVGGFDEVTTLVNQPFSEAHPAIADFFAEKKPTDLLLLYFSGHGVLDDQGRLYLAVKNTRRNRVSGTAIAASYITDEMNSSRSRRQVLILDCCHSGAFARGAKGATGAKAVTPSTFEGGYGRVVLTATDATQYAWEGDQVIGQAENSVFTHYLIQGLQTGHADANADGWITLDELYDYVYDQVQSITPRQTPNKFSYREQGEIIVARNPRPALKPSVLPPELLQTLNSPLPWVREGAVLELDRLLHSQNLDLSLSAREALQHLAQDDSRAVSSASIAVLAAQESKLAGEKTTATPSTTAQPDAGAEVSARRAGGRPSSWIGRTIGGRYQIESLLGQGGMSAVYKGADPNLRRAVAIKLIHPHLSSDPEFVRRFEQEAAAVAQLRHPNIIQVFDFDHEADVYYMVLEYLAGKTLQATLTELAASSQRLRLNETLRIMAIVCDAVAYAHQRGLVHRDLKPGNVMIDPSGQPVLMDFGVARMVGAQHQTATGALIGTVAYMAPEQVRGEHPDARADIYSLGVVLYEMAAGHPPFEAESALTVMLKHLNEPAPDIRQTASDAPDELAAVIEKTLAKDPAGRFQTATELAAALREIGLQLALAAARAEAERKAKEEAELLAQRKAEEERLAHERAEQERLAREKEEQRLAHERAEQERLAREAAAEAERLVRQKAEAERIAYEKAEEERLAQEAARAEAERLAKQKAEAERLTREKEEQEKIEQERLTRERAASEQVARPARDYVGVKPIVEPRPRPTPSRLPLLLGAGAGVLILIFLGFGLLLVARGRNNTSLPSAAKMAQIPGGEYTIGLDKSGQNYVAPHQVSLPTFWIDQFEVTNAEYRECVEGGDCTQSEEVDPPGYRDDSSYDEYPVAGVTWDQANAYCRWANKRLPAEAEWEVAARGQDGRLYPWGDNLQDGDLPATGKYAVGTLPKNRSIFNAYDLAGNVWEWVDQPYAEVAAPLRVQRGGQTDLLRDMAYRQAVDPQVQKTSVLVAGIRCAADQVK